jgi:hypothetical protein
MVLLFGIVSIGYFGFVGCRLIRRFRDTDKEKRGACTAELNLSREK